MKRENTTDRCFIKYEDVEGGKCQIIIGYGSDGEEFTHDDYKAILIRMMARRGLR